MTHLTAKTGEASAAKSTTETVTLLPVGLDRNGRSMARWTLVALLVTILMYHSTSGELHSSCSGNKLVGIIYVSQT